MWLVLDWYSRRTKPFSVLTQYTTYPHLGLVVCSVMHIMLLTLSSSSSATYNHYQEDHQQHHYDEEATGST